MSVETGASTLDVLRLGNQLGFNFASNASAYSLINKYIRSAAASKSTSIATENTLGEASSASTGTTRVSTSESAVSLVESSQPTTAPVVDPAEADRLAEAAVLGRLVGSCVALNKRYMMCCAVLGYPSTIVYC